jgi:saccharopine dehydrogenase-like NADP-dependent oxidoreductase
MKKILVLGAGLVGKIIALDLAKSFDVTSADINEEALQWLQSKQVKIIKSDIRNREALTDLIKPFDLIVGAVPGFMGFEMVKTVIEGGKNIVDISFFPEDPFLLDDLAKKNNVTVITDCGVAPGMSNIILGYHNQHMKVHTYECLVGGLPAVREWPYEYRAVFSPIDVIEEYIRPARFIQNGAVVIKEALSDAELINFEGIGTLESWNSDGLRTLIKTMHHVPNMIEKTLRYPGTIQYLRALRETGYFSYEEIKVNGVAVRPIDVTAKLLFPKWKLKPGEEEFTVMRIRVEGEENGVQKKYEYNLLDRTDTTTGTLSMARTTGFTCTAAVHLVLNNQFNRKGICPPEYVGEKESDFKFILNHLKQRGVIYTVTQR